MNKIKQLASETILYGMGNMIPKLLNYILFPIHTTFFAPEEYGVFTYLMSFVALLNVVYSFGMETAFFRFVNKPGANPKKIFNLAQTVVVFISVMMTVIFIVGADMWAQILDTPEYGRYIIWLAIIMMIDGLVTIPFAQLRFEKKAARFALFKIANIVVLAGLNIYFLYFDFNPTIGIGYIFIANLVANALYILFFTKVLWQWRPTFDREISRLMFRYAYPIMVTGLAGMMSELFSRLLLLKWLPDGFYPGRSSEYALGVFGACYKFSVLMNLATQAFRMAAEPFFFSQAENKRSPELFASVNHYFIITTSLIMLLVAVHVDELKHVFLQQESYWEGLEIVPPLLLGYLFLGVYYNFSVWFKLTDRTYFGTFITVGGAVLTIVLNFLLIPMAGYLGSSWVTAIVYGSMMAVCYALGQRYYPIPYKVWSGLSYIVLALAIIYGLTFFHFDQQWEATALKVSVIGLFIGIIWIRERKSFKALANQ